MTVSTLTEYAPIPTYADDMQEGYAPPSDGDVRGITALLDVLGVNAVDQVAVHTRRQLNANSDPGTVITSVRPIQRVRKTGQPEHGAAIIRRDIEGQVLSMLVLANSIVYKQSGDAEIVDVGAPVAEKMIETLWEIIQAKVSEPESVQSVPA